MRILHIPDANTEGNSSAPDDKGVVSSTAESQKGDKPLSALATAMSIATASPGGEGEVASEEDKSDKEEDGAVLKKNGTDSEEQPEGEEKDKDEASEESKPEGDEEKDGKQDDKNGEDDEDEEGEGEVEGEDKDKPLTAEQKAEDARFDKHPRFQELNNKVKSLEPLAESQRGIMTFCEQHNITGAQFQQALQMAALMNVDPVKARAALLPIMESLDTYVGERLPKDLQDRVDKGTLDINDAKEMSQLRAKASNTESRTKQTIEQQFNTQCIQAVTNWETSKKKSDPDYAKKEDLILDSFSAKINSARAQGKEPSPQDRVRFAEESWEKVTKSLTGFLPPKPQRRVLKVSGMRTTARAEAKSPLEVALQTASKHSTD